MMKKEINIPKAFQELHGRRTSIFSLVLVYFTAVSISTIISFFAIPKAFPVWKTIIFMIVLLDISGGVIANFTNSTNEFYRDKSNLRSYFLGLHVMHPIMLVLLFPAENMLFLFMGIYTLICCFLLNLINGKETQRLIAVFFVSLGITMVFIIPCDINILRILPVLFFLKLILGFSVKHEKSVENT